jgi:NAD(P)H-hydrate epimerase
MPGQSKPTVGWLNRRQVRAVDRIAIERHGMSGLVLMENAGRGVVDTLETLGIMGPVVICCGKGNNGGDGFVIARHLLIRGHDVRVVIFDDPDTFSPDAAVNYLTLLRGGVSVHSLDIQVHSQARHQPGASAIPDLFRGADWILDGLLGTGAQGAPRSPYSEAIEWSNAATARRLAIDWPSGLDCDSGVAEEPTFRADHTCTFVASKTGARNPVSADYLGTLHVLDIGVLPSVIAEALREEP